MTTFTITINAGTPTPIGVNALDPTDVTNAAAAVLNNTNWTTATSYYLVGNADAPAVLKTLASARDVEIQTWTRNGIVYHRMDASGNGIYFALNMETVNGQIIIGIVTGESDSGYLSGTYYPVYVMDDMVGTLGGIGFSKSATDAQVFTFGVSGYDIYCKFNGTEFVRFKEFRAMNAGSTWLKAQGASGPYGFRTVVWTTTTAPSLFSDGTPLGNTGSGIQAATVIDSRDWNIRPLAVAVGSMSAGGTNLALNASPGNPGFMVGDTIIVEIGGESGAGLRGSIGVGGSWPKLHYADLAAMNADATQPDFRYAWVLDTGFTYWWTGAPGFDAGTVTTCITTNGSPIVRCLNASFHFIPAGVKATGAGIPAGATVIVGGGTNFNQITLDMNATATASGVSIDFTVPPNTWTKVSLEPEHCYYTNLGIPRSLLARITGISGLNITLDTPAVVATINAKVYLDNTQWMNYVFGVRPNPQYATIIPTGVTFNLAAGTFYIGGIVGTTFQTGMVFKGQGQGSTTIQSPKGVTGARIGGQQCDGIVIRDFTFNGNLGLNGFGMAWGEGWVPDYGLGYGLVKNGTGQINLIQGTPILGEVTGTSGPALQGVFICEGISTATNNASFQDLTINDVMFGAITNRFGTDCWARRVHVYVHEPVQTYIQWQWEWVNNAGGGFDSCTFWAVALTAATESFAAVGTQFINCSTYNGLWSINYVGGWVIEDCTAVIGANSFSPESSINNPILNIDTNTGGGGPPPGGGGTLRNFNITINGPIDAFGNIPFGIIVNIDNPDINIIGGSYRAPNWIPGSTTPGPVAINSTGTNCNVDGFICYCADVNPGSGYSNIVLTDGSVKNSSAKTINAPITLNNTGCIQFGFGSSIPMKYSSANF